MFGDRPRLLYYAFGGGLGHATRALALMRQLALRCPGSHRLLVNSPFADVVREEIDRIPGAELCVSPSATSAEGSRIFVADQISGFRPDGLIVDTFPRGLGGEFTEGFEPLGECSRVLISRGLPPAYVETFRLNEFVDQHYQLVIAPGEVSPFSSTAAMFCETAPFLIRNAGDLNLEPTEHNRILFVGSGTHSECRELNQLAQDVSNSRMSCHVVLALPSNIDDINSGSVEVIRQYPLMERLSEFRGIIGAAGYNLAHEAAALRIPTLLFPRGRLYDDQRRRANTSAVPSLPEIRRFTDRVTETPRTVAHQFENGAAQAAEHIAMLFE